MGHSKLDINTIILELRQLDPLTTIGILKGEHSLILPVAKVCFGQCLILFDGDCHRNVDAEFHPNGAIEEESAFGLWPLANLRIELQHLFASHSEKPQFHFQARGY